jgi:hypothetical protein
MALKVVPAGDERCDIHTQRTPQRFICQTCLKELGNEQQVRTSRGSRRTRARRALRLLRSRAAGIDRKVLMGAGALSVGVIIAIVLVVGGGGGGDSKGPTEAEVVDGLDLVPGPSGEGWVTSDGACAVTSIKFGTSLQSGSIAGDILFEVTNEDRTVGAVVSRADFSISEAECVDRIGGALQAQF